MFSDRWWLLKGAAALGLLAWLCTDARRRTAAEHPDVERGAVFPDRSLQVYLWAKRVRAVEPGGFQIDTQVGPVHILSGKQPPVGEFVSVLARFSGPRTLEAVSVQINEGFAWKRPLNYGVSILTLIGYLWLVRRHFRWRIHEGVFRGKY